jgi:elongation factor P
MNQLKKGLKIEFDNVPYKIIEYQHVKPGKGAAFVRTKLKSYMNSKIIEKTFHAGDKCEMPDLQNKTMQFLYDDGESSHFMDNETYEQTAIPSETIEDTLSWIIDGSNVEITFFHSKPITVEPPTTINLKVVETPPNFKGDSQGGKKPALLESGSTVQVPFHVLEGDTIKVDTVEKSYVEKIK